MPVTKRPQDLDAKSRRIKPRTIKSAAFGQKLEILDWHHANGSNQTKSVLNFKPKYPELNLSQPVISRWLKNEVDIRKNAEYLGTKAKRTVQFQQPVLNEAIELWVIQACEAGLSLTGDVIRQKYQAFANEFHIPQEERTHLSNGWLGRFKARTKLREYCQHGEAASTSQAVVEKERERCRDVNAAYSLEDQFNMDETGLFYA